MLSPFAKREKKTKKFAHTLFMAVVLECVLQYFANSAGPGCSKLTTLLVNVSLNFQKLISQICQYFL